MPKSKNKTIIPAILLKKYHVNRYTILGLNPIFEVIEQCV